MRRAGWLDDLLRAEAPLWLSVDSVTGMMESSELGRISGDVQIYINNNDSRLIYIVQTFASIQIDESVRLLQRWQRRGQGRQSRFERTRATDDRCASGTLRDRLAGSAPLRCAGCRDGPSLSLAGQMRRRGRTALRMRLRSWEGGIECCPRQPRGGVRRLTSGPNVAACLAKFQESSGAFLDVWAVE